MEGYVRYLGVLRKLEVSKNYFNYKDVRNDISSTLTSEMDSITTFCKKKGIYDLVIL